MKKHIIFDIDGTLLDSMRLWEDIDRVFLTRHGYPYTPAISQKVKVMKHLKESAEYFCELLAPQKVLSPAEVEKELADMCAGAYENEIPAKPFVKEFLYEMAGCDRRMCVATASQKDQVDTALTRLALRDYFQFIFTTKDAQKGKDDPGFWAETAAKLGAQTKDTAVFEDSLHAAAAAKAAGCFVIGVYDETNKAQWQQMRALCDRAIRTFEELCTKK